MKKVVFFIPTLGQGGAEKVFLNLANEFAKKHQVYLVLQSTGGVLMKDLSSEINVHNFGMDGNIKLLFKLMRFVSIIKPDVIISTLNVPNIVNALAHKLSFRSYILITRQASPVKITNHQKIISRLLNFSFKQSKVVIANSLTTKKSILESHNLSENEVNIEVIYNPVFENKFYDLANDRSKLTKKVNDNGRFILAIGRLEDSKNFKLLIKAYSLSKIKEEWMLIILGEGSQRAMLEKLIGDFNLKDRVLLPGNISNPYPFYNNASLFISSSRWEGFGNVIVEALSFGLPIIITDSSGAPSEILDNGIFGFEVANDSPQAMADKIDEISNLKVIDKQFLKKRALDFSIEKISCQYESTFN